MCCDRPLSCYLIANVRLYRDALSAILSDCSDVDLVGVAPSPAAASLLGEGAVDVVIVDVPRDMRSATVRAALGLLPGSKVLAIGVREVESEVVELAEAGADGYVSDQASVDDLLRAVVATSQDELYCSPRIASALLRRARREQSPVAQHPHRAGVDCLTEREVEVLRLVESGLSNKQIARRLQIALPTAKNHMHNILQKLHACSRTEALARLREDSPGTSTSGSSRA